MQQEFEICLHLSGQAAPAAPGTLLGQGVRLRATVGQSLRRVLVDQIGMNADYLENRVQTVFLNGHPVDDLERAIVAENAVIALSAAMPGLAGATLRRGGHLAAMRRLISEEGSTAGPDLSAGGQGLITLKLFNVVAREAGWSVLARGILLTLDELEEFVQAINRKMPAGGPPIASSRRLTRQGVPVTWNEIRDQLSPDGYACLKVLFD